MKNAFSAQSFGYLCISHVCISPNAPDVAKLRLKFSKNRSVRGCEGLTDCRKRGYCQYGIENQKDMLITLTLNEYIPKVSE